MLSETFLLRTLRYGTHWHEISLQCSDDLVDCHLPVILGSLVRHEVWTEVHSDKSYGRPKLLNRVVTLFLSQQVDRLPVYS